MSLFSRLLAAFKKPVVAVEAVVVDAVDAVKGSPAVKNDLADAKSAFEAAVAAARVSVTATYNELQALVQKAEADAAAAREALRGVAVSPVQPVAPPAA